MYVLVNPTSHDSILGIRMAILTMSETSGDMTKEGGWLFDEAAFGEAYAGCRIIN